MSDLEEHVAPYDVRIETVPAHRFFTAEFQSTLQDGLGIARDTVPQLERLASLVGTDSGLEKLLGEAKALRAFHGSDTKTIAVLGDSGEGTLCFDHHYPNTLVLSHAAGCGKVADLQQERAA
jgi:hypothetical protein